ncbi:MAG: TonB-dependent receptor [Halieaceae bacterium]|jgi:iron complex outermembrane recepter protein|nr:TonB-dependent receptor [Halieaceae bacterium]
MFYNGKRNPIATATSIVVLGSVGLMPTVATAQEQGRATALEEVLVTAQKREESLQAAPIAITAFSASSLQARGIVEPQDVAFYTPNMVAAPQPGSAATVNYTIRGKTQTEPILTIEPSVGIYMNGVYMARNNGLAFEVADIERIEVLRGPQGTLYGKNTTGGAVNIVTSKPKGEFAIRQKFSAGNRDLFRSHTTIDTPTWNGFSAKLSYLHKSEDGYIDNLTTKAQSYTGDTDDFGAKESDGINLALHWDISDSFSADYIYDQTDATNMPPLFQSTVVDPGYIVGPNFNPTLSLGPGSNDLGVGDAVVNGVYQSFGGVPIAPLCSFDPSCVGFANTPNAAFGGATPAQTMLGTLGGPYFEGLNHVDADDPLRGTALPYQGNEELDIEGHSLELLWEVSDTLQIKSITAYREMDNEQRTDLSGGGWLDLRAVGSGVYTLFANGGAFKEQEQFSQELQFIGSADRIEYVAGLYYFEEEAKETRYDVTVFNFGDNIYESPDFPVKVYETDNEARAIFGQVTYTPPIQDDRLRITLGLRYSEDDRALDLLHTGVQWSGSEEYDNTSGDLTLSYEWNDEVSTYLKYATGYSAGGFHGRTSPDNQRPYDEETVESFEFGLKSQFLDNRVRINAAIFYNEYEDLQLTQFVPSVAGVEGVMSNIGEATIQGVELEVLALLGDGLTLSFVYGYLDAEFDEYDFFDPTGGTCGTPATVCNVSDNSRFPTAAENNVALGLSYEFAPFSFGNLSARVDVAYNDGYQFGTLEQKYDDVTDAESHTLVNARVALTNIDVGDRGKLVVAAWGQNLTDEEYRLYGIPEFDQLGFAGATFNPPRSYGLDVIYEFE